LIKIEAVIRPNVLDAVKACLDEIGVHGLTVTEVRGAGKQKGYTQHYRGEEYAVNLLPKIKLEVVVPDVAAQEVVDTIIASAKTGAIGDGKIFLSHIDEAIRIRTSERGDDAL
jgi:nitrogen regulatory protein P-II 1